MINQYLSINKSFDSPFVFCLTQRGFYSEINNLLNAVMFGLVHERRLVVDECLFGGLKWQSLFATNLPVGSAEVIARVPADWIVSGVFSPNFSTIQKWADDRFRSRAPLAFPLLGMSGSLFHVKCEVARTLTRPPISPTFPTGLSEPFAAVHIRRGDKTEGFRGAQNSLIIEGDEIDPSAYIEKLANEAPEISSIFAMTDDFQMIEDLKNVGRDYAISTLCEREENGYWQPEFSSLEPPEKTHRIRRLIAEVQIASASSIFLGGYKSNVARYVPLLHKHPDRCFSVDAEKRWRPT